MYKSLLPLHSAGLALLLLLINVNCTAKTVEFWNGNKTESRQQYELSILNAALDASRQKYGDYHIVHDSADLSPDEESAIFRTRAADVFVTVAGNPKLKNEKKRMVAHPLMKGLLGYRLLIVREADLDKFSAIQSESSFKDLRIGVPEGWADADLFRHNGYNVVEGGTYDTLFDSLASNDFDYVALGANEIEKAFRHRAAPFQMFVIEPDTLLYYPFALVFYVNPDNPELAERLRFGLDAIDRNGVAQRLFEEATGDLVERLRLKERKIFRLENPLLPAEMRTFRSDLLKHTANE